MNIYTDGGNLIHAVGKGPGKGPDTLKSLTNMWERNVRALFH